MDDKEIIKDLIDKLFNIIRLFLISLSALVVISIAIMSIMQQQFNNSLTKILTENTFENTTYEITQTNDSSNDIFDVNKFDINRDTQ